MPTTTRSKHKKSDEVGTHQPKKPPAKKKGDKQGKAPDSAASTANKTSTTREVLSVLSTAQRHQILLDIEKHPHLQFKQLCKLYPVYYKKGDPQQGAFRNRFNYLNRIKKEDPQQYWELYGKAGSIVAECI
ncbi:hypothetical protein SEMRO_471_G149650.1 [Seminavis robusta]|uniref:Uncharacterized protein n=1 Tax=Seminavis robusta TaxID=568900 RepID=A0A9N8DYA9_9STRA|nr:hypothetical protein SEMRO_471_G149650.1 [Seminavis robusta]|eukprot:Sro471_g149650.1 n/a (131) ;mRNA; f:15065-15457